MPRAVAPPPVVWQAAQFVAAVKPVWSVLAPSQVAVVLWQLSQAAVVTMCVGVLPRTGGYWPLWQVAQPGSGVI